MTEQTTKANTTNTNAPTDKTKIQQSKQTATPLSVVWVFLVERCVLGSIAVVVVVVVVCCCVGGGSGSSRR